MTRCPQCDATIRFYANAIAEIEIDRQRANRERDEAVRKLDAILNQPAAPVEVGP